MKCGQNLDHVTLFTKMSQKCRCQANVENNTIDFLVLQMHPNLQNRSKQAWKRYEFTDLTQFKPCEIIKTRKTSKM